MTKTYTTVPDKASGDQFTEAMWDDHIKTNINNFIVPPTARVTKSAVQSITTAVETAITWDTETWDNDTIHSTSVNTDRFTPTTAGLYIFGHGGDFVINATGYRYSLGKFNGTTNVIVDVDHTVGAAIAGWQEWAVIYKMNGSTDYMSVYVGQTSGGNLNYPSAIANGHFTCVWIGRDA